MNENNGRRMLDFIETLSSESAKALIKSNKEMFNIPESDYTKEGIVNFILNKNPINFRHVISICYALNMYAKHSKNEALLNAIASIDKTELWKEIEPTAKRFITNNEYDEICSWLDSTYEPNSKFKQILFRCVYEGVYSKDLDVIRNLRASDINGNILTLRDGDGIVYDFEVSYGLANDLIELSRVNTWEKTNSKASYEVTAVGQYPDSCFKFENRGGDQVKTAKGVFWGIVRQIAKDYIGSSHIRAKQIFISGLMYRVALKLKEHDIPLEVAFDYKNIDKLATKIILDEMVRCNYQANIRILKETVDGYLDNFRI